MFGWRKARAERDALRRVILRVGFGGDERGPSGNWGYQKNVGHLLDWLDSEPELATVRLRALEWFTSEASARDPVGEIVAMTIGISHGQRSPQMWSGLHYGGGPFYGVSFHYGAAGHMSEAGRSAAAEDYSRLLAVDPSSISGLSNLAECFYRDDRERCLLLAQRAFNIALESNNERYGLLDSLWVPYLSCQLAELQGSSRIKGADEVLASAERDSLTELIGVIRGTDGDAANKGRTPPAAFAAFADASRDQRVSILGALRIGALDPSPVPSHLEPLEAEEAANLARGQQGTK